MQSRPKAVRTARASCSKTMTTAVYSGTFDPMTLGHMDILTRASKMFDRVIVAVAASSGKKPLFTLEERIDLVKKQTQDLENISVSGFEGLLRDFVRSNGASVIVRGVRGGADFDYEYQMAGMNRLLMPEVDTIFLIASPGSQFVTGTFVRELAAMKSDLTGFVAPCVAEAMKAKQ